MEARSVDERFRDQIFLVHRQTSARFAAETCIDFPPRRSRQRAGLSYQHGTNQYCLRVGWDRVRTARTLGILVFDRGKLSLPLGTDEPVLDQGSVRLRLEVDGSSARFFWTQGTMGWEPLGPVLESSPSPDDSCLEEAFVGLASQDPDGQRNQADFSLFLYETFD